MKIQWNFRYNLIIVNQKKHIRISMCYVFYKSLKCTPITYKKAVGHMWRSVFVGGPGDLVPGQIAQTPDHQQLLEGLRRLGQCIELPWCLKQVWIPGKQPKRNKSTPQPPPKKKKQKKVKMFFKLKNMSWVHSTSFAWIFSSKVQSHFRRGSWSEVDNIRIFTTSIL